MPDTSDQRTSQADTQGRSIPPVTGNYRTAAPVEIRWVAVGSYSACDFHQARAILTRHGILSRALETTEANCDMALAVPQTEVEWARELIGMAGINRDLSTAPGGFPVVLPTSPPPPSTTVGSVANPPPSARPVLPVDYFYRPDQTREFPLLLRIAIWLALFILMLTMLFLIAI